MFAWDWRNFILILRERKMNMIFFCKFWGIERSLIQNFSHSPQALSSRKGKCIWLWNSKLEPHKILKHENPYMLMFGYFTSWTSDMKFMERCYRRSPHFVIFGTKTVSRNSGITNFETLLSTKSWIWSKNFLKSTFLANFSFEIRTIRN